MIGLIHRGHGMSRSLRLTIVELFITSNHEIVNVKSPEIVPKIKNMPPQIAEVDNLVIKTPSHPW